jgi:hypothetical protein
MPTSITRQFPDKHIVRCRVWYPPDEGERGHSSVQVEGPVPAHVADALATISIHVHRLDERDARDLRALTARLKKRAGGT